MNAHHRFVETARRVRDPLYLVTALYVVVGLGIGGYGAFSGDRLAAFLGFFFISGALCAAFVFHGMAHLAARIAAISEGLEQVRRVAQRLEHALAAGAPTGEAKKTDESEDALPRLDLNANRRNDPSLLASATLERDTFPRLAAPASTSVPSSTSSFVPAAESGIEFEDTHHDHAVDSLLRAWKTAQRESDLAAMRQVLAALTDMADPDLLADLRRQCDEAADRMEKSLRSNFSERVRRRDFAGALAVGRQMTELLPHRPVVQEFESLRPLLLRRMAAS